LRHEIWSIRNESSLPHLHIAEQQGRGLWDSKPLHYRENKGQASPYLPGADVFGERNRHETANRCVFVYFDISLPIPDQA
jgi:hypothetical protein